MGTGDRTDPTTDFFDTHRAQCVRYAEKLRQTADAAALVAKLDEAVALCAAAIARGRLRADMTSVVQGMQTIVTRYHALPEGVRSDLEHALRADAPPHPSEDDR
jgi:hypothetical protein